MPRRWSLPEKALSQRQCLPDFQSGHRKTPEIRRCREDPERTMLWSLNLQHTLVHTLFAPKHTVFAPCLAKPFSSMPFLKETQVSTGKKVGWHIINRGIRTRDVGPGSRSLRILMQRGQTPLSYPLALRTLSPWERQKAANPLSPGSALHPALIHSCCPSAQPFCLWPQRWPTENKLIKGLGSFGSTRNYMWCFMRWAGVRDNGMQILWHGHSKLS